MACGCGGAQAQELWEVVYNDRTVSSPMSKPQATSEAHVKGGFIREVLRQPAKV
jgi:hypothetical protein